MNPYAILSLVAAVLGVCIGVYVLRRDPKSTLNRIFALLAFAIAIWCFGQFMHRVTPGATSLMWYRISGFGWCFVAGIALHFTLVFAKREKILGNKLVYLVLYGPSIIFLYLSWTTDLIFQLKITEMPWGNTCLPGDLVWTYTIYVFLYIILGIYFCSRVYRESPVSVEKKQSLTLIAALLTPLAISGTTDLVLPMMGIVVIELAALSCAVATGIVAYAILKYKLFILPPISRFFIPMPEAGLRTEPKYELEPGRSYSIKEKEPEHSARMFKDVVSHGTPGLWITFRLPEKLRQKHGLVHTPILSMIAQPVKGEATMCPDKLVSAKAIVSDYLSRARRPVVLIDCLYMLSATNGFEKALGFLKEIKRICLEKGANLIVTFDPKLFTKRCLADIDQALRGGR